MSNSMADFNKQYNSLKAKALKGRSWVGTHERGADLKKRKTKVIFYQHDNAPEQTRVAIRFYSSNVLTFYPNGTQVVDLSINSMTSRDRINTYLIGANVFNLKGVPYVWTQAKSKGFEIERGVITLKNYDGVWLPENHETRKNIVWSTYSRIAIGKRWYVNSEDSLIHRCGRRMHGTVYDTTKCAACGEDAALTHSDLCTKMQAAQDFRTLQEHVGVY